MNKVFGSIALVLLMTSCLSAPKTSERGPTSDPDKDFLSDKRRGSPAEYDPGAPKDSKWIELFGSVPNYRSLGKLILGGGGGDEFSSEKFRWIFGPMWYRGRLGPNEVKVFVVGQEGAQDENVSNRAFTGSTGTKTQRFLNHLGIYRSYLFLNTFVYTINGQLEPGNKKFEFLEQDPRSPIVQYRHSLFDQMAITNQKSLSLIMGVGAGGKRSVSTWIESHGGSCDEAGSFKYCDTSVLAKKFGLSKKILVIGVPHPGGANPNMGGADALKNIIAGFSDAARRVAQFSKSNPGWLDHDKADEEAFGKESFGEAFPGRLEKEFRYRNAPIPYRDFAYGTNWRMGKDGTTSNRWKARTIQVFSDEGEYSDKSSKYAEGQVEDPKGVDLKFLQSEGMPRTDVPWEPPRAIPTRDNALRFDVGPCGEKSSPCRFSELMMSWQGIEAYWRKAFVNHPSLGFQSMYRGRLNGAEILILGDQESHDDLFSGRALTGLRGQRLQTAIKALGVGSNYLILRSLPVDALEDPSGNSFKLKKDAEDLALSEDYLKQYQSLVDHVLKESSGIKLVVTWGSLAAKMAQELKFGGRKIFVLDDFSGLTNLAVVQKQIADISSAAGTKASAFTEKLTPIPREDLPYHSRWWMGTSGNRALRALGVNGPNYYRVYAPSWVDRMQPPVLDPAQSKSVIATMKQMGILE